MHRYTIKKQYIRLLKSVVKMCLAAIRSSFRRCAVSAGQLESNCNIPFTICWEYLATNSYKNNENTIIIILYFKILSHLQYNIELKFSDFSPGSLLVKIKYSSHSIHAFILHSHQNTSERITKYSSTDGQVYYPIVLLSNPWRTALTQVAFPPQSNERSVVFKSSEVTKMQPTW